MPERGRQEEWRGVSGKLVPRAPLGDSHVSSPCSPLSQGLCLSFHSVPRAHALAHKCTQVVLNGDRDSVTVSEGEQDTRGVGGEAGR